MFLKKIELNGFKSFARKTVFDFSSTRSDYKNRFDITAIVGPNGSGKSNVADAVRWAMGEQSLKNIRGKKSEDVIFAGSGKKNQLGSAKVSLYFDNEDKRIPIEFSEVVISRRIYRSGESEYMINQNKSRLIDVIDLLAKAGIGQRSYCIINQGMADSLLIASPIERRAIIEEAAGVKIYQLKKERSLRKLDSTRSNLVQVESLIHEIEPHLKVLRRQAEKAKKGADVARELQDKQKKLFSFLWNEINFEKQKCEAKKEELGRERMKLLRRIDDLEISIKKESPENDEFDKKRKYFESKKDELYEKLAVLQKKAAEVDAKMEIEKQKAKNFSWVAEIPVDYKYIKNEIKKFHAKFLQALHLLKKASSEPEYVKAKAGFEYLKFEIDRLVKEMTHGKKEETNANRANIVDLKTIGSLEKEKKEINTDLEKINHELEHIKESIEKFYELDRQVRKFVHEQEIKLSHERQNYSKIQEEYENVKVELARLEVREEDLKRRMLQELDDFDPAMIGNDFDKMSPEEVEKMEKEIQRLKILSEQIGSIDPMIIEEYEETEKRYEFLTNQSQDLQKAILTLSDIIKEMDDKIAVAFDKAFNRINHEFSKYFKIIFGGGNAHLQKVTVTPKKYRKSEPAEENEIEEEEKDESATKESQEIGIEIGAFPPGKKIKSLDMLSGGERSLTSQALLFAIIANNPPPFAILDEVDAALDEANSRRLSRIFSELAKETQFIIITHNRETMRQASLLYGVTMSDDGVSKVLSVKIDQVGKNGQIKAN